MQDEKTPKEPSQKPQKEKKVGEPRRNQGIFNFASAKPIKAIKPHYQTKQTTTKNFFLNKKQQLNDQEIYGKTTSN